MTFETFFRTATGGRSPYDYQSRLAEAPITNRIIHVPTGAGKTAAAIVAWLWRYRTDPDSTPRRLVYCLPMRVLVDQTRRNAEQWIERSGLNIPVRVLKGGEVEDDWEIQPEVPFVLIGTQDMLLSRALNRGYAMSRYRWPTHFALLNNDCLWVYDEVQLMGDGLATSCQLASFREHYGAFKQCPTIWMSATVETHMLQTVDFPLAPPVVRLEDRDVAREDLYRRWTARKQIEKAPEECGSPPELARFLHEHHRPGTQTIVVLNTVRRARETFDQVQKLVRDEVPCHLLHARFRQHEKQHWSDLFTEEIPNSGRILVATQVIEAGVDISSSLLITDLAPWPSLVQRFGRCNRAGEYDASRIMWIDQRPKTDPYEPQELDKAAEALAHVSSAAPCDLPQIRTLYEPTHVLRRQDLIDLFDTTSDLSGYDVDISRFVRSEQDRDVWLAWRTDEPSTGKDAPGPDELCSAPIHEVRSFIQKRGAWTWNSLAGAWVRGFGETLRPGTIIVLLAKDGGYDAERGLDLKSAKPVETIPSRSRPEEGNDDDPRTFLRYTQTLAAHSREALAMMETLLNRLGFSDFREELLMAALHHDWGKAHPVFQATVNPESDGQILAKSRVQGKHARKRFRHELASALAVLQTHASDLTAYLVASHHGKVRLSIRALPDEDKPEQAEVKFARGVHEGDALPGIRLSDVDKPAITLDLEPMLLGESATGQASWTARMLALRDEIGIFRLAYLEALIVAADCRASATPEDVLP